MIRYALHPGPVLSKNDKDRHIIGAGQLARLYKLQPNEWFIWDAEGSMGRYYEDYVHLFPRYDGNYGRPA